MITILELRDQLRKARLDEERASNQLQKSKAKVAKLEVDIAAYRDNAIKDFVTAGGQESSPADQQSKLSNGFNPMSPMPATVGISFATGSGNELVSKLNTQLIQVKGKTMTISWFIIFLRLVGLVQSVHDIQLRLRPTAPSTAIAPF